MIEALFSSKTRVRLLARLLLSPGESFYVRQLAALEGLSYNAVQREAAALSDAGILSREESGNRVYYSADERCPIYGELRVILLKTVGLGDVLRRALRKGEETIRVAFLFGSFGRGEEKAESDVDLAIIGSISSRKLSTLLAEPKRVLGREVNYVVFPVEEFRERLGQQDHFVATLLREPKFFLVGDEQDLAAVAE